jgi:hypothetical protein
MISSFGMKKLMMVFSLDRYEDLSTKYLYMHEKLTTEKGKCALPSSLRREPAPESSMANFNDSAFKLVRCQHFGASLHESLRIGFDHRFAHVDSNTNPIGRIVSPSRYLMVADQSGWKLVFNDQPPNLVHDSPPYPAEWERGVEYMFPWQVARMRRSNHAWFRVLIREHSSHILNLPAAM